MIDIISSKYDLSRRVSLYNMHGLSFREHLEFHLGITLPTISLDNLIKNHVEISQTLEVKKILKHFNDYLQIGYYPFTKEIDFNMEKSQAIEHIVQKTIYEDIAIFRDLKSSTLMLIEKLFKYIACSTAGELNPSKLASHLGKDFDSISNYLSYLEKAGLIHFMYPKKSGKAHLRNPIKMLPENPNMMYAYQILSYKDDHVGKLRETFFVNQLRNSGHNVYYSTKGDYSVNEYHFEIGGKNKTTKQVDTKKNGYVLADNILVGHKNTIPLYLAGFLY